MVTIQWKLSEKQAQYLNDKHRYLVVEGSARLWKNPVCLS